MTRCEHSLVAEVARLQKQAYAELSRVRLLDSSELSRVRLLAKVLVILLFGYLALPNSAAAQMFSIPWHSIDAGAGNSTGGSFQLDGTVGQHDAGAPMTGGDFKMTGGFRPGTPAYGTVIPNSVNVILGKHESGQVEDLAKSDDSRLCYLNGNPFAPGFPAIWLEIHGQLPTDTPQSLVITLESQVNDIGIEQEIFLYNYDLSQFDSIDTRQATKNTDGTAHVYFLTETFAAPYVEPGTGNVRAKVTYTDSGIGFFAEWKACMDQFIWKYR